MLNNLPEHLSERVRVVTDDEKVLRNGPVVVWLKSSHRFHENGIDVGRIIAENQNLPMLVYHTELTKDIHTRFPASSQFAY